MHALHANVGAPHLLLKMLLIFHFIQLYTAMHKQRVKKMDNVVLKSSQRVFPSFSSPLTLSAKGSKMVQFAFQALLRRM